MSIDSLIADPEFFRDPYPIYRQLRQRSPVAWSEQWGGWVLTRYDDVVATLRTPQLFSSAGRISYLLDNIEPTVRATMNRLEAHYRVGVAHMDPPDHTRLRALITPFFTPRSLAALQPRIDRLVDQLLDRVEAAGHFDLIHDLAYPLPAIVILDLLGAPTSDIDHFRRWALHVNTLFAKGGRVDAASAQVAQASLLEMRAYISDLLTERSQAPRQDLLSHLLTAQVAGERLSEAELISTAVTLFVAGHETTTNLIGNGLLALLRNRSQWELLRNHPELTESAIEELLRYDTPVQRGWRIATQDVELGGQRIGKGQMILQMLGSANHDPDQFVDPDRLDITRSDNRHLGFGYGIHFCLGAPLARMEVAAVLTTLGQRYLQMTVDESTPLVWRQDIALRGVERLPVVI